jgi:hypothetical protein
MAFRISHGRSIPAGDDSLLCRVRLTPEAAN